MVGRVLILQNGDLAAPVTGARRSRWPAPHPLERPRQLHRGVTLLAVVSLFIGTRGLWTSAISARPVVAGVVMVCYAAIMALGVLALTVRTTRGLTTVDLGVLLVGIALVLCAFVMVHYPGDEGAFTGAAAKLLVDGKHVYGVPMPWIFDNPHVGLTKSMTGGGDYTYVYPPLAVLLTAPVTALAPGLPAATMVTTGALLVAVVVLWIMLPAQWRSAATATCLGFGILSSYARLGYPAIIALALLVPVVVNWPATGAGGRLGRAGLLRAACLGAACAAQQLPWFLTPFLLLGIYAVRRGELPARQALGVVGRYAGLAGLTFLLINAYFVAQSPRAWLAGVLGPLHQHAVPHGQGLIGISYYFTEGSGRLDFYTYAAALLFAGLLAMFVLFLRRLGPAATVLPWCAFYLATRSQDGYYLLMTPLWLAAAATAPPAAFARAWQLRLPGPRKRTWRAVVAGVLLLPAAASVSVAALSSPPLRMSVTDVTSGGERGRGVWRLTVQVTNTTGKSMTPHFAVSSGPGMSAYWRVDTGPSSLAPHRSASYVITAPNQRGYHPARLRLRVVTGGPMTISSTDVPA